MFNLLTNKVRPRKPITVTVDNPHIETSPTVILLHGAHQSSISFGYLQHLLKDFRFIRIDWDTKSKFDDNLSEMIESINTQNQVYFIGHSMGGIYAAHLAQHFDCIGGAAVAVPWAGSHNAEWLKYFMPFYSLYHDASQTSPIIDYARKCRLPGHWTNYVSTVGDNPAVFSRNDGVLSLDTMVGRGDIETTYLRAGHYEIISWVKLIESIEKDINQAVTISK